MICHNTQVGLLREFFLSTQMAEEQQWSWERRISSISQMELLQKQSDWETLPILSIFYNSVSLEWLKLEEIRHEFFITSKIIAFLPSVCIRTLD